MNNQTLIEKLKREGTLRSKSVESALFAVDRYNFVPKKYTDEAYDDHPLSIGEGQTISQPTTVVIMLELLDLKRGDTVLEIGGGSGWVTALMAHLVGDRGHIWAYEINDQVAQFGCEKLRSYKSENFTYIRGDATKHWEDNAPYDRIIAGAAFPYLYPELKDLLKSPGITVIPLADNSISRILKDQKGKIHEERYYGFVFVPLQ
jgi:protein-L-isoaspartate(D-aspartate) O-methyltransferase